MLEIKIDGIFIPFLQFVAKGIDVWGGTSGMSHDVPRFGLRIHSVSNTIGG